MSRRSTFLRRDTSCQRCAQIGRGLCLSYLELVNQCCEPPQIFRSPTWRRTDPGDQSPIEECEIIGTESTAGAGNIPIGVDPADGRSQSRGHGSPSNQAHPSGNLGTNRAQPFQITPPNASPLAEFTWCLAKMAEITSLLGGLREACKRAGSSVAAF